MRKRFLYGSGIVVLLILTTLVMWQVSFRIEESPANLGQTFIFWAVSTLVFVLTVTLAFILFRTAVKLYLARQVNRQGSRIESKLFFGALALSFMPVCFLVAFSYMVLNRQVEKWFSMPKEQVRLNYIKIGEAFGRELHEKLDLQAALLAHHPETVDRFCQEQKLAAAEITRVPGGQLIGQCGNPTVI